MGGGAGGEMQRGTEALSFFVCRKWLKAEIGSDNFADFGLGLESVIEQIMSCRFWL
jgi:hypothetical protein